MAKEVLVRDLHRIVATCIIYKPDRTFLLCKRPPDAFVFKDKWGHPGGGMDRDDYVRTSLTLPDGWTNPLEAALRREVRDEVGLEVGELKLVGGRWGTFSHIRDDDIAVFGIRYFAPYKSGKVKLNHEHVVHRWISAHEIGQYDCMGGVIEAVESVRRQLMYKTVGRATI